MEDLGPVMEADELMKRLTHLSQIATYKKTIADKIKQDYECSARTINEKFKHVQKCRDVVNVSDSEMMELGRSVRTEVKRLHDKMHNELDHLKSVNDLDKLRAMYERKLT
jgi:hypothetical protein